MRLKQLINSLDKTLKHSSLDDFEVKGIACDSRQVQKNFIFVAIRGNKQDGHNFIQHAIDRGARLVVTEKLTKVQNAKKTSFIRC